MDPITISLIVNAGLTIAGAFGWIKKKKEVKELTSVLDKCGTDNEELKKTALEMGAKLALKLMNKLLP